MQIHHAINASMHLDKSFIWPRKGSGRSNQASRRPYKAARRTDAGPRRGFSLIELLVVVTIVGLLLAILVPQLTEARQIARRLQCMSNQRSINVAILYYVQDNRGWYPLHGPYPDAWYSSHPHAIRAKAALDGYLDGRFPLCPDCNRGSSGPATSMSYYIFPGTTSLAGHANYSATGGAPVSALQRDAMPFPGPYWSETNIPLERRMPMVSDANWSVVTQPAINPRRWVYSNHKNNRDASIAGANAIFYDGHGEWRGYDGGTFQYWYQPVGGQASWGYYGSVYYPLPRF